MQKKLIAAAVAGALTVPSAAMAAEHVSLSPYFRINNALEIQDTDGADTTFDLRNVSSRIGLKGSSDLGNGTTVFGQYEFATNTDIEGTGIIDTRIAKVGLSGSFGSLSAGNMWGAFYNYVGVNIDPTMALGSPVYWNAGGTYRSSNTISYSNSFGPVSLTAETRVSTDDEAAGANVERVGGDTGEDMDGFGLAGTFTVTEAMDIDVAYDVVNNAVGDDLTRMGASGNVSFGSFWGSLAYMDVSQDAGAGLPETDNSVIAAFVGNSFTDNTSGWVGYQTADQLNGDPSAIVWQVSHFIGGGPLRVYYEGAINDNDGISPDSNTHLLGLRIDM